MSTKKFRLIDVILSVICVVFVAEAVAPAAAIGNSQFFWWIFLFIAFAFPYGLVVCEMGTTYSEDEGGLYDWVRRAFGDNWAGRVAWYYWINFPLWIASLAILFPSIIGVMTGTELGIVPSLIIELSFIWIIIFISFSRASDSIWIMNTAAILKVAIALVLGGLGIYYATHNGFANDMSFSTFLPSFDASAFTYLSVILYNFMGFEVIATFASDMQNPKKQIPKAIVAGGIAIALIYMIGSFGIGAAIPIDELSLDSGILDAVSIMTGNGSIMVIIFGVAFLATLFGNMASWSLGVNFVGVCAAKDGNFPKAFATETKKNSMPKGISLANGIIASIICLLSPLADAVGVSDLFWTVFGVGVVFLLLAYIPMFPAFLKLRKADKDTKRIFKVPGGNVFHQIVCWLPVVLILLTTIVTVVPLNGSADELAKIPMLVTVVILALVGELIRYLSARGRKETYLGMAKSGAPAPRVHIDETSERPSEE